ANTAYHAAHHSTSSRSTTSSSRCTTTTTTKHPAYHLAECPTKFSTCGSVECGGHSVQSVEFSWDQSFERINTFIAESHAQEELPTDAFLLVFLTNLPCSLCQFCILYVPFLLLLLTFFRSLGFGSFPIDLFTGNIASDAFASKRISRILHRFLWRLRC